MKNRSLILTAGTAMLIGSAALLSPVASAGSNVGWSVSVDAPGIAVTAGQPAYRGSFVGTPYRPYYRPYFRPLVVAPPAVFPTWYAPVVAPLPFPIVVAPPVVVALRPYARARIAAVRRPYFY